MNNSLPSMFNSQSRLPLRSPYKTLKRRPPENNATMPGRGANKYSSLVVLVARLLRRAPPTCNSPNHADACFRGLWNVPFISNCYLINATIIANKATRPSYENDDLDTEMAFAHGNRQRGLFMYVNNRLDFGHLVNPDTYDIRLTYPDMYQIMDNKLDWEKRYIHPNYSENFNSDKKPIQVKMIHR